ncbi:MAG: hypothetical protein ACHQYQ_04530 [Bacteriovoracales bacterium]
MKKGLKIFLMCTGLIVILIFGLSYYAYKKLSTEEIRKMTIESLDNQFKNAKTHLGEVTLDFGFVFKVGFKDLKVENGKADLFSIKELKAKIPFYSVLFGAGAIDLNLVGMKINYLETPTGTNWEMKKTEKPSGGSNYSLLLANTKINLSINDLNIFYALKTGKSGEFNLEEAKFFNLNFLDSTKFRAKSQFKGSNYSIKIYGEGEIDLSNYWDKKLILGKSTLNFSDFQIQKMALKNPTIKTDLTFSFDAQGKLKSSIQSFLGKDKIFETELTYHHGLSVYEQLKLDIPLDSLIPSYGNISLKGNRLKAQGKLTMSEKEMNPDLSFTWDNGPIVEEYKLNSKIKGTIKNNLLQTEISATLMENPVSGTGAIILGENYVKIPKMNLRLGGGKGNLSTQVYLKGNKKEGNFDASFEGINLKVFNPYFPKGIGAVTGTLFGKFKGDFLQGEKEVVISNGIFDLKALDGAVKEFNMEKHIIKVISSVPFLYATKKEEVGTWVTGDFQLLQLNGKMDKERIVLDNIHFLGIKNNIEIKGKGELNKTQNSQVMIDFIDHKGVISAPIKKYTGSNVLKFKFMGSGFDLSPDYGYTINSLGSQALKANEKDLEEAGVKFLKKLFKK